MLLSRIAARHANASAKYVRQMSDHPLSREYVRAHVAKPSIGRQIMRVAGMVSFIGAAGGGYMYKTDEGTRRSLTFWSQAFPIYLHYRVVQLKVKNKSEEEANAAYDRLHEKYAPVTEKLCLQLRGFYLKTAQLVSVVDYFVPQQYLEWCKRLQDEVPVSLSSEQVRSTIEANLGKPVDELFDDFEDVAVGSASIGQVHRAKLKGTDTVVAIKVQGPEIEKMFRSDIATILNFCRLAMPQHVKPMEEIESQFETEFDYVGEARNLLDIYSNIMPKFGSRVAIPRPFMELCTRNVLVMEFLEGESLLKGAKKQLQMYADSLGRPYEEVEAEQLELLKGKKGDIESEAAKMRRYQYVLDAKIGVTNALRGAYNWTAGWMAEPIPYAERQRVLNLADIIQLTALVHGYEIMVDGCFNCDPHPGNIVLMPDGRLGLIDYGQCKRIDRRSRVGYAQLIIALAEGEEEKAVEIMKSLGYETKYDNPEIIYKLGQFWHNKNTHDITGGRNVQEFIDYLESTDPVRNVPGDLVFAGRASVLLRGCGNYFGLDMKMAEMWKPIAEEVVTNAASLRRTLTHRSSKY